MKVKDIKERINAHLSISPELAWHLDRSLLLRENIFREGSKSFFDLIEEVRHLYEKGEIELDEVDVDIIESDIGKSGIYEGQEVFLDFPIAESVGFLLEAEYKGKKVELSKPKRGGDKKFYVYVMGKNGKVKKVSFGSTSMSMGLRSPERKASFRARHNCEDKNDKEKPGYWACRIGRYPKVTGAPYATWW